MDKDSDLDANGSNPRAAEAGAHDDPPRGGAPLTSEPDDSQGPDAGEGEDEADVPDMAEGASEQNQVGPGHPPRDTRWKKGGPSPNPRGRPRKDETMRPDVKKAFEQALNKKVSVTRGERKVLMTRLELGFEQLLNQFAKGDRHARRDLMGYADKLGIDLLAKGGQAIEQALTPSYQAILDAFLARRQDTADVKSAEPVPAAQEPAPASQQSALAQPVASAAAPVPGPGGRVFASADLLDDDAGTTVAAAPEAPPPAAKIRSTVPEPTSPESVSTPRQPVLAQRKPVSSPAAPVAVLRQAISAQREAIASPVASVSTPGQRAVTPPAPAEVEAEVGVEVEIEVPLPTPIPGRDYSKPPERMTFTELRSSFPEWCAQYGEAWSKQQLAKKRRASMGSRR